MWVGRGFSGEAGVKVRREEQRRQGWRAAESSRAWPGGYGSMSGFHSKGDEKFILRKIENSLGI